MASLWQHPRDQPRAHCCDLSEGVRFCSTARIRKLRVERAEQCTDPLLLLLVCGQRCGRCCCIVLRVFFSEKLAIHEFEVRSSSHIWKRLSTLEQSLVLHILKAGEYSTGLRIIHDRLLTRCKHVLTWRICIESDMGKFSSFPAKSDFLQRFNYY